MFVNLGEGAHTWEGLGGPGAQPPLPSLEQHLASRLRAECQQEADLPGWQGHRPMASSSLPRPNHSPQGPAGWETRGHSRVSTSDLQTARGPQQYLLKTGVLGK